MAQHAHVSTQSIIGTTVSRWRTCDAILQRPPVHRLVSPRLVAQLCLQRLLAAGKGVEGLEEIK